MAALRDVACRRYGAPETGIAPARGSPGEKPSVGYAILSQLRPFVRAMPRPADTRSRWARASAATFPTDRRLLDRDALRQVPRLVDVGPAIHGDVIREQLERDREEQRRQELARARDRDHLPGHVFQIG